jgi:hypothetical protein
MAARRSALAGGFYWVGFLFVVVCLNGCSGGSDVDTQQVSGTVMYNGNPVANVAVTFNPDGDGWPATGTTDAEGQFESLTTREGGDGIAEGQYTVTLSQVTGASTDVGDDVNAYSPTAASDLPFPTKYLNTAESDLKVTISADGEKTLTLELKD